MSRTSGHGFSAKSDAASRNRQATNLLNDGKNQDPNSDLDEQRRSC
jgi:hypothetical protein